MKFSQVTLPFALLASTVLADNVHVQGEGRRALKGASRKKAGKKGAKVREMALTVTNLHATQFMGFFFLMIHDDTVPKIFTIGEPASVNFEWLTEVGNPGPLVEYYETMDGVYSAIDTQGISKPGGSYTIPFTIPDGYYVTLATMVAGTNDGFVAINGESVNTGDVHYMIVHDAGTENNDESCDTVPGPPTCTGLNEGFNESREGAEGFVTLHRGIGGRNNELLDNDWRGPVAKVKFHNA